LPVGRGPASDGAGIAAQEDAQTVFVLDNTTLQIGHGGRGHGRFGISPIDVQLGGEPLLQTAALELHGLLAGLERAPRDLQLPVQFEQIEVRPSHIGHQRHEDDASVLLAGQQLCAGRLGGPPQPPPQVQLEGEVEASLEVVPRKWAARRAVQDGTVLRERARVLVAGAGIDLGELGGARDPQLGA
jgi:hypothetical protein